MEVRVQNLRKEFDRFPALHDISLDIRSGELIALLGPSGSGKTTLLRLIAGLESPTEGLIYFGDEDASKETVQQRNIGFVFQHYALFRYMTVLDNIAFGAEGARCSAPSHKVRDPQPRAGTAGSRAAFRSGKALSGPALGRSAPARRARARSCGRDRTYCFSTSLLARSTPKCERTCANGSVRLMTAPVTPRFSSRMTRTKRWNLPTASSS